MSSRCAAPELHKPGCEHTDRPGYRLRYTDGCVSRYCRECAMPDDGDALCPCERGSTGVYPSARRPCPWPLHHAGLRAMVPVDTDGIPYHRSAWTPADVLAHLVRMERKT